MNDETLRLDEQLAESRAKDRERDPLGKAALFSQNAPDQGSLGRLALECSVCGRETPTSLRELPRLLFPFTITLPKRFHTFMMCPACGRRTWVRAHWRV
ncbi:MAG: hypothetical protein ACLGH3_00320 [Actinomycetota bacterium]